MYTVQRRRFRRITVIQAATLSSPHTGSIAGEIRDFSPNGVLFAANGPAGTGALLNQSVTIEFRPNPIAAAQYRITGSVVRTGEQTAGIAVEHFPADAYRSLVSLTNQPKRQTAAVTPALYSKEQVTTALAQCHTQFKSFITHVIAHFYNSLGAKLAFSAEHAGSLEERWILHNAYPRVAAQRSQIETAYLDDNYLNRDVADDTAEAAASQSLSLSLVDVNDFDDWLAVSQMVNKLNQEYAFEVGKFESRYEVLVGTKLSTNANPFGPHYIFQTLRELLSGHDFQHQLKSLLYRTFEESIMVYMGDLYRELNGTLAFVQLPKNSVPAAAASVKPAASAAAPTAPATSGHNRGAAMSLEDYLHAKNSVPLMPSTAALSAPAYAFPQSVGLQQIGQPAQDYALHHLLAHFHLMQNRADTEQDYQLISNKLQGLPAAGASAAVWPDSVIPAMHQLLAAANPGGLPSHTQAWSGGMHAEEVEATSAESLNQILSVLNLIQQQRASGQSIDETSIKHQLVNALPQFENAPMQDRFFNSIHLFDEMLSSPLSDDALNSDIRSLLKKIELTLLKLALMDEHFLRSSDHPAQQTVNLLERFYAAADDMGKIFDPQLQRLLNMLANQIVDQFESKPGVFDEVNQVLANLLTPVEAIRKSKVEQIRQACAQREQLDMDQPATAVENAPDLHMLEATGINLLRQDNWLGVMVDGVAVPYQLVWLSRSGKQFVLASRSATTIREFPQWLLAQDMAAGQVVRLPEYDIPFMERSAHKVMLNAYERVYQQATHDAGSGLLNRKGMVTRLEQIFASDELLQRHDVLCMLMFDQLDLLYHNCDTEEAEASLMSLIGVIANEVKPTDVFARLGENTFAILLHDSDTAVAQAAMQAIVAIIGQQRISCQGRQFSIGVNVGVAQIKDDINSVPKLLKSVGSACVAAKAHGINCVQVYAADSEQIMHEQSLFEWAGAMDQVMDDHLLFLRCQRIQPIGGDNGLLPHYEILLGLDKRLTATPQDFVLAAEKWNRSADIDLWVLQQSFDWLIAQGDKLDAIGGISINLSGHSLANEKILDYISQTLQAKLIPAGKIIFEITETAVISRLELAQRFIEIVRGFGCRFSLDDFGSGYSSFAYLQNLNVDFLKIDGAFIRGLAKSPTDFAMVKSMYQVSHAFGLKTIAEYVENDTILDILRDIGVEYAQGYGIEMSRPLSTLTL
jgi:diguanylate cyclase (GGDEF)-like protein